MSSETEGKTVQSRHRMALALCSLLVAVLWVACRTLHPWPYPAQSLSMSKQASDASTTSTTRGIPTSEQQDRQRQSGGSLVRETIAGVDVLWQGSGNGSCRGILLVAHGCSHSHTDFWSPDTDICPDCLGLPEERAIVKIAINDYNLVVVAVSSQDRRSKCWSAADGPIVAQVLQTMQNRWDVVQSQSQQSSSLSSHNSEATKPPILAFGASSGGYFVQTELARHLETIGSGLDAILGQIAGGMLDVSELKHANKVKCIIYLTMNRDEMTDVAAASAVQQLKGDTDRITEQIRLPPLPLTPKFFTDRIGADMYSEEESSIMVQALRQAGMVDEDGFLSQDPRRSDWRSILQDYAKGGDSLVADRSPISEALNAAYGMHEMTRNGVKEALDLCGSSTQKSQGSSNLLTTVYQYRTDSSG